MRHILLISLLLLGACAGNAQRGDDGQTVRAKQYESEKAALQAADRDDVVCTYERTVGSHLKKSICMTAAEREARAEQSRDSAQRAQRTKNSPTSGTSDGI